MTDKKARIQIARPTSRKEVYSRNSSGRAKQIVKSAIQQYIDSYFNSLGVNRTILESAIPQGMKYVTDETFTDIRNPEKRKLFLARMYEQTKMQLPSIIISDTSFDPKIELRGLGALDDAKVENGIWKGVMPTVSTVGINISILAKSEEDNSVLFSIIDLIFGTTRNIGSGSYIRSNVPGESWSVKLPLNYSASGTTRESISDDPVDAFWASTFDLEVLFESSIVIQREAPLYLVNDNMLHGVINLADFETYIDCPDSISVNEKTSFTVYKLQPKYKIVLDNPKIATIEPTNLIITPKRVGSFKILVLDTNTILNDDSEASPNTTANNEVFMSYKIVTSKDVTVIW